MLATVARMATVVATGGETHTDSPSQRIISWTVPVEHMEALLFAALNAPITKYGSVYRLSPSLLSSIDQGGVKRRPSGMATQ
jgi:hypothetical protein